MKVTAFICISVLTSAQLLLATPGYSQNEKKIISLNYSQASIKTIFNAIEKKADVVIMFEATDAIRKEKVSVAVKDKKVADILDELLLPKGIRWAIRGNIIRLYRDKTIPGQSPDSPKEYLNIQEPIQGRVVDFTGTPLAGATVKLKGTTKWTTTDGLGRFSLNANVGDILTVSFIGFSTVHLKLTSNTTVVVVSSDGKDGDTNTENGGLRIGQTLSFADDGQLRITLSKSETTIQEVVFNGGYYQTTKKKSTGNIAKISSKDIGEQPLTNPLMALQGRVAGVEVMPTTGVPGGALTIKIRGQNSMRKKDSDGIDGNLPLYIIDGIPINSAPFGSISTSLARQGFDPLSSINPTDIESIEILKDADATAIYGSRGANGVILITTKRKKNPGKLNVDLLAYRGVGKAPNQVDMLNTEQYLEMRHEAIQNDGGSVLAQYQHPVNGPIRHPDLLIWDTTRYTDWQKYLLKNNSHISDANIRLAGGNEYTSFSFSGGYHKETLPYPGDFYYRRITGTATIDHASQNRRLNISLGTTYGLNDYEIFSSNGLSSIIVPPNAPVLYKDDGSLNWAPGPSGNATWANPAGNLKSIQTNSSNSLLVNGGISYSITSDLKFKTTLGYSNQAGSEVALEPLSSKFVRPGVTTASRSERTNARTSWIVEPQLDYTRQLREHTINFLVGFTAQQAKDDSKAYYGSGYTSDAVLGTMGAAPSITIMNTNTEYRYAAGYFRAGYDYKSKYYLNVSARRDGSSRFGPDYRYGNFGAVGAAWIFTKEPFIANNLHFLNFGKIRASYGTTGNDQIGDSKYLGTYTVGWATYHGSIAIVPTGLFNPDYAWELTKKLEFGTELGFFNDRLSVEASWYRNRSSNQLVQFQLPITAGFSSILANFGATIENKGWEFNVNGKIVNNKKVRWSVGVNFSNSENKLVEFPGIESSTYATRYKVGQPLSIQYGYKLIGVDPATGLYTFYDADGDEQITMNDMTFIQPLTTKYFGGITNSVAFKGLELSFLLQFSDRFDNTQYFNMPGTRGNQPVTVLARWRKPGDITTIQRYGFSGLATQAYSQFTQSNGVIENISYVRLRTATISYSIQPALLNRLSLRSARAFIQGQNLLTWSNFSGLDPETLYGSPQLRIISGGLQIGL